MNSLESNYNTLKLECNPLFFQYLKNIAIVIKRVFIQIREDKKVYSFFDTKQELNSRIETEYLV